MRRSVPQTQRRQPKCLPKKSSQQASGVATAEEGRGRQTKQEDTHPKLGPTSTRSLDFHQMFNTAPSIVRLRQEQEQGVGITQSAYSQALTGDQSASASSYETSVFGDLESHRPERGSLRARSGGRRVFPSEVSNRPADGLS